VDSPIFNCWRDNILQRQEVSKTWCEFQNSIQFLHWSTNKWGTIVFRLASLWILRRYLENTVVRWKKTCLVISTFHFCKNWENEFRFYDPFCFFDNGLFLMEGITFFCILYLHLLR
jgi:hypothetical protein